MATWLAPSFGPIAAGNAGIVRMTSPAGLNVSITPRTLSRTATFPSLSTATLTGSVN